MYGFFSDAAGNQWRYFRKDEEDDDDRDETTTDANDSSTLDGPDGDWQLWFTWGTYGKGKLPDNKIPGNNNGGQDGGPFGGHDDAGDWFDDPVNETERKLMMRCQLGKAWVDTQTTMKAFSKSLPPIVYDFQVSSAVIGGRAAQHEITFKIEENRKPTVALSVTLGGHDITDTTGKTWDGTETVTLDETAASDTTVLPYKKDVTITWRPADADWLVSGTTTLQVKARDEDGHWSEAAEITVMVDAKSGTGGSSTEKDK